MRTYIALRRRDYQAMRGMWVQRIKRGLEQIGLVGSRNWEAKRKRRFKKAYKDRYTWRSC